MEYVAGLLFSLAVAGAANVIGFDRDRSFYPTVLIVIALVYVLFAATGESRQAVLIETLVAGGFLLVAVAGFKTSLWFVAAAIVAHGLFDFLHQRVVDNPAVPAWWPGFCATVDLVLGFALGMLLLKRSRPTGAAERHTP